MTKLVSNNFFIPFNIEISLSELPEKFNYPYNYTPHSLCIKASEELQQYLKTQTDWEHNFGLDKSKTGTIIGKMFGVMVVKNKKNELGYIAAFSGKLADNNTHDHFVPPVYDALKEGSFLNLGMQKLTQINTQIKNLEETAQKKESIIKELKLSRKEHSTNLQNKLFDHYIFLNKTGTEKNLRTIFNDIGYSNPPSGAGECAAPKLLQYAFQQEMTPIAIAEFWWGLSPKSDKWKHKHYYPVCREKCEPILNHMLKGMSVDDKPE
jgi:tRNA pseudouridine32 synthase/23S rRNA pseudouridine746 synthase